MGQIEPADRAREAQQAWRLFIEGKSKSEIARTLKRDRRTVDNYLEEAAEWYANDGVETKRYAIIASHRKLIEKAWEMLNSGEIKPTSLAGPQWAMQAREALKEWARLEGLHIDRKEIKHGADETLADIITRYYGADNWEARMDTVDAEVVEDDALEAPVQTSREGHASSPKSYRTKAPRRGPKRRRLTPD